MYIYSATTNAFYPIILKASYEVSGTWPVDGIEVTEEVFLEYSQNVVGKHRVPLAGLPSWKDGAPEWIDHG